MFRRKRSCEFIVLLLLYMISEIRGLQYVFDNLDVPCSYFDTVNITDGKKLANGSYLHEGIVYPKNFVGTYNYKFVNLTLREPTKAHLRGCICLMKNCIRMCCKHGHIFDNAQKICRNSTKEFSTTLQILDAAGVSKEVDILKSFGSVYGRPCESSYYLTPLTYDSDRWDLFENGTILRWDDMKYLSKDEYCLSPSVDGNASELHINPAVCFQFNENKRRDLIYGIAMLTSVPFLIATIIIYIAIPELRNLHGKSLCCYLFSLVVGYTCLGFTLLEGGIMVTDPRCETFGYMAYFSFMASFLWLSVISFDLWWNFRIMTSRGEKRELKRFILYSIYSWGLAAVFLISVILIQNSGIPEHLKPGIGGGQFCWLDATSWMQLVYFYGQLIIIITFNIVMFVLTSYKIHKVKKETSKVMGREDSRRNYNREKDNVGLFLRLFIVMGVTWSMDILSWLVGKRFEFLFYITDICNAIQGFIIFILFVMKKKVKRLIVKKYNSIRGIRGQDTRTSQYSTKTVSSNMSMATMSGGASDKTEISLMPTVDEESSDVCLKQREAPKKQAF